MTARGNFEGGDTVTMGEFSKQNAKKGTFGYVNARDLRIDKDQYRPLIVVEDGAKVHRRPPAKTYLRVEHEGGSSSLVGTFHGLKNGYPWEIQVTRKPHTAVCIDVGDGYYSVWGRDLEEDLKR